MNAVKKAMGSGRGFTLVELLIGLAISAIILVGLSAIVIQMIKISPVASDRAAAIRDLDGAGSWFIHDFESTSASNLPASVTLVPTNNGSPSLTIVQSLLAKNDTQIKYSIDSNKELLRNNITSGTTTIIASNISQVQYVTGSNKITITSTIGAVTETRTYQILSRVT